MSNVGNFERIWVGDLDGYISIGGDVEEDNPQEDADDLFLEEVKALGPIGLLGDEVLTPDAFTRHVTTIAEWTFELYRAHRYLRNLNAWNRLEPLVVRQLMSVGRAYAIRRYARTEKIPFVTATLAAMPYGMQALMGRFLLAQGMSLTSVQSDRLQAAWKSLPALNLTAYGKTGLLRNVLYEFAEAAWGMRGPASLPREPVRQILSLARLHFSVAEMQPSRFTRFSELDALYAAEQRRVTLEEASPYFSGIRNWRMRHLRPLMFYYPYAIRNALVRGQQQTGAGSPALQMSAAHEIALAHCAFRRIQRRQAG